ncbi:alpha/beta hydrolase [bacterium]
MSYILKYLTKRQKSKFIYVFFLLLFFICNFLYAKREEVSFESFDNTRFTAFFEEPSSRSFVVLIHDYSETADDWGEVMKLLAKRGYGYFAYNLRKFDEKKERVNRKLKPQKEGVKRINWMKDLEAAMSFLELNKKVKKNEIIFVGSGLGANLSLKYASMNADVKFVILISPGLNYQGVSTAMAIQNYGNRPLMFIASVKDTDSYDTCLDYMGYLSRNSDINTIYLSGSKRGIRILNRSTMKNFLTWMDKMDERY